MLPCPTFCYIHHPVRDVLANYKAPARQTSLQILTASQFSNPDVPFQAVPYNVSGKSVP